MSTTVLPEITNARKIRLMQAAVRPLFEIVAREPARAMGFVPEGNGVRVYVRGRKRPVTAGTSTSMATWGGSTKIEALQGLIDHLALLAMEAK